MALSYKEIQQILMEELRLYHYPIAVHFFFDDKELDKFKNDTEFYTPAKPLTFCQWEIAARMKGQTVLGTKETLDCSAAQISFGWKEIDAKEIQGQAKYCRDFEQAERFIHSKPRLPLGELKAISVSPLGDATLPPSTVHFYCDNMQAYHLCVDYMVAMDQHPLTTNVTMSSSACGGNVYSHLNKSANLLPACSGSYNSGKTERGEINFMLQVEALEPTVQRLLTRKQKFGSSAITKPGDHFPGADVCKNCPLILFKKA